MIFPIRWARPTNKVEVINRLRDHHIHIERAFNVADENRILLETGSVAVARSVVTPEPTTGRELEWFPDLREIRQEPVE